METESLSMKRTTLYFSFLILHFSLLLTLSCCTPKKGAVVVEQPRVSVPSFDADSAYRYVSAQVAFGPRVTGSEAHKACGDWLAAKLKGFGADVTEQTADLKAYNGDRLPMRNIIGSYNTATRKRIVLCSHWDSRPWADNDPDVTNHRTPIDGANDGASGVGVLLEIARQLGRQQPTMGVDIIFFDAEDYGMHSDELDYADNTWCLGSQYWARHPHRPDYMARFGILLDMVGAPDARFCQERYSRRYAGSIVDKVWQTAHTLGFGAYFPLAAGSYVTDDHLPLNEKARIPTVDIIPYDDAYGFGEHWHTVKDNMAWIDRTTLRAVGQTVLHVIYNEK